jgi:hypothetical protein
MPYKTEKAWKARSCGSCEGALFVLATKATRQLGGSTMLTLTGSHGIKAKYDLGKLFRVNRNVRPEERKAESTKQGLH